MIYSAQIPIPADPLAIAFLSGPQFFIALTAGVTMAFAFQFLLSNLLIATGISAGINPADSDAEGWGQTIRRIEAKVGTTTLFIVNTAVFTACFLAVKLTLIQQSGLGAIVAIVIWSAYFLLLLWVSAQAIGSLAGAVGQTAGSGIQGMMAIVGAAVSGPTASRQISRTVATSVDAVSQELQSVLSADQLRENLEDYLAKLSLPQLGDQSGGQSGGQSSSQSNGKPNGKPNSNGKPNGKEPPNQVLSLLSQSNLLPAGSSELIDLIKSANAEDLTSGRLRERLTQLLGLKQSGSDQGQTNSEGQTAENQSSENQSSENQSSENQSSENQTTGLRERTLQMGMDALISTLVGRGLSNLQPETLTESLGAIGQQVGQQANQIAQQVSGPGQSNNRVIQADIEHYLLDSPGWYLRAENLDRGFREVLFDPEADAGLVRQQLEPLNRAYFVEVLHRREGVNPDQINDMADELEVIRREVLDQVRIAAEQERSQTLRHQVETYLKTAPKQELNSERISQDFTALLADPEATYETLGNRLLQFDRNALMQILLAGRQDLDAAETEQILNDLEGARDRFLNQSQETWNQLQDHAGQFRQQVEAYLRETNPSDLTGEAIQQTIQTLLNAPEAGLLASRIGLGQLDRAGLEQILADRQDLNPEQVNQLIEQVESIRDRTLHAPQELAEAAKAQVDQLTTRIADYLRSTQLEALDPESLQQALRQLLEDPQAGISDLGTRLSHIDRDTLVQLLSQQTDWSPEQVNRAIDQVQSALQSIARTPRQVATRARDQVQNFSTDLTDYLRQTNREELNPEGIRRDLQRLIRQPRAGAAQLGDRLSQIDRGTLVALLAQREDVSEEEANQIVDQVVHQVETIRDQIVNQAENVKDQVKSTAQQANESVRGYLNSLDRPELNYEGIRQDLRQLFDDPQAGFEALRDRLGQFDRETLVALLSTRSDLSEEQVNQVIDQIEAARNAVLERAERVQSKTAERIQALKQQAKAQAEEVQKTTAVAAWWVFGIALTSVASATIAGLLASGGFDL